MRYIFICFLLLFISVNTIFAQQSIGFSNPDSLQPLLDYRLPDWGYSNFYLDFDANGNGSDQKSSTFEEVRKNGIFSLRPVYNLFRESEQRILRFNTSANFRYSGRIHYVESTSLNEETEGREGELNTDLNLSLNLKEYVTEGNFIFGASPLSFNYRSRKSEDEENGSLTAKRLIYNRTFSARPRLGYGFGRIRNVNPVIRAVRLKERTDVLNIGQNFSSQDILRAADQFTRYGGYQQTYDRPAKYFWGDMDEMTTVDLEAMNTFDMFYLTDVLDEAIGTRLEGWEAIGGLQFDYQNNLRRTEDQFGMTDRQKMINKEIGGFLNGRWYKNTSLKQQWGLFGEAVLSYPLGDEEGLRNTKRNFVLTTGVEWLWNVTDRLLFRTSLTEFYRRSKIEASSIGGGVSTEFSDWLNRVSLSANLNFFVENQTVINISAFPSLTHFGNTESENKLDSRIFSWGIRIGLRYYFSRNLY
jgi:hypothetical protein